MRQGLCLVGACLIVGCAATAAHAQNATWLANPGSNDFNTGANWSTGSVPTGTASFGPSNTTTIGVVTSTSVGVFRFDPGAAAYTFGTALAAFPPLVLNFTGAGIINGSSNAQTFSLFSGILEFSNSASAGNAIISNNFSTSAETVFRNSATAGSATITNDRGRTFFVDSATAGNANIRTKANSFMAFQNASTAGNASLTIDSGLTIVDGGRLEFQNASTAANATVTNSGFVGFRDSASAGNATIVNNNQGFTSFLDNSTAGNATLIANSGGVVGFSTGSSAAQARLIVNAGGQLLVSGPVTVGSIEGAGSFALLGNQLTVGTTNLSTEVSGTINGGGGSLVKVGTGTLTLSGTGSLAGGTSVAVGRLVVNGTLTSDVTVGAAGNLGGTGTIAGNMINNGMIAPGNSIGSLTINGNFTQNAGGTYQVEVNPAGQSDRLNVNGTATLNGGMVNVLAAPGTYAPRTTYTILNATGGVTGTYAGVTRNLAFLLPSLSYDANDVFLTLTLASSAFASAAQSPNQRAVGTVLDQAAPTATGDFATVIGALLNLNTTQGPAALNTISGQPYANNGTMGVQTANAFMSAFGTHVIATHGAAGGSSGSVALAQVCDATCDAGDPARFGAWLSGIGGLGSVPGNANAGTFTYNFGGAAAGLDYRIDPHLLVGAGVGYTTGTSSVDGFSGRGQTDAFSGSLYGSFTAGDLYVDGVAGYAGGKNRMTRAIAIPGLAMRTTQGITGVDQFLGLAETGYRVSLDRPASTSVTPFARVQGSTTRQAGFTETGADSLNLTVALQTTNSLRSTFGVDFAAELAKVNFDVRLGWLHEYADIGRPMTATFAGAPGNSFTVFGATPTRDSAAVGFWASARVAEATSVYARYDGEVGGGSDNHAFTAGLRMRW